MADSSLIGQSITDLAPLIEARKLSPVELVDASAAQIERLQPELKGFITLMLDQARETANQREQAIMDGDYRGPLDGIPVGIKDGIAVAGVKATVGALAMDDHVPSEDAEAVRRLRAAGAIIMGKENMHEFAAGGRSNNPHYGVVQNPWALDRIPGRASSGGSGANLAAGLTLRLAWDRRWRFGALFPVIAAALSV